MTSPELHEHALRTAALADLIGAWWFNYDEWNPETLRALLVDDVTFSSRSDSGATDYEDFIRADLRGIEEVMAWQSDHRANSPYPLRHNGSCLHITGGDDDVVEFSSYIFVTKIVDGRPLSLSSGTATGAARITGAGMLLMRLVIVLDTSDSVPLVQSTHRLAGQST
ncbi:hypothetical protein [Gordonia rubripertincta]|uniref:SnoaL-like domain-containing protein n=1 Tax=Gordonia rubripertincta TaxID=36822 RepID=A0ABT4MPF6_GORRU|nr:hypothetical protein [Gordonia rubripertincta]MCZ4548883.1 hypothetical protein [Gordonia rubripertincta]